MRVQGQIFDHEMLAIPYANVTETGNPGNTVAADANGEFSINVASQSSVLRFSHAGYDYDEVTAADFLKAGYIELWPTSLDEVIVGGHTQKKTDNTLLIAGLALAALIVVAKVSSKPPKVKV